MVSVYSLVYYGGGWLVLTGFLYWMIWAGGVKAKLQYTKWDLIYLGWAAVISTTILGFIWFMQTDYPYIIDKWMRTTEVF